MIFAPSCAWYYFAVALVLALLEIQIEGPSGWAAALPTWRWDSPWVRRWIGKPVTGYHVFLNMFILLMLHLPFVAGVRWTLAGEMQTLSIYFLISVFWDFLWFVCNRHFGLGRFKSKHVWWFQGWWMGIPQAYFFGVSASFAASFFCPTSESPRVRALGWLLWLAWFFGLTLMVVSVRLVQGRCSRQT